MRILMLAQSFAPVVGGEERIVEDLSAELAGRGHEVAVATLRQPAGEPPQRADGVRVHLLGSGIDRLPGVGADPERRYSPSFPDPVTVRDLRRVLGRERPDVVHAHNWLLDSFLPLDRSSGPALLLSLHDYGLVCATKRLFYKGEVCSGPALGKCLRHSIDHYGPAKGAVVAAGMRISEPFARRRVDMYLPVSEAVREMSRLRPDERTRVIPNFIGELPAPPAADVRMPEALPAEPFLLYFGDVTEDKGGRVLLEAYAELEQPPPLVLVGRVLLEGVTAAPGVVALGRLPHELAIEALRRSLFTIAPSIWAEPFGIVALEAAAAGKPAIASDIGGLKGVVVDGKTGYLVPAGDVGELRGAIEKLAADPALRERMGAAARARAEEFSPDAVVPRFESAYEAAVAARRMR